MAIPTDELHVDSAALERYQQEDAPNKLAIRSLDDIKRVSLIFVQSGMFKADQRTNGPTKMYQAAVKIIAGVEFGIQPFAAMRGINIINGNAEMSANLMAAKVKKHPKYDYRVKQWDREGCVLTFFEILSDGTRDELGDSSFDGEDARQANLTGGNWQKFARNMYFARAMSNGVRIYCPDVFYGAPVYTEGEISGEFEHEPPEPVKPPAADVANEAEIVDEAVDEEPLDAVDVKEELESEPASNVRWMSDGQRKTIMGLANQLKIPTKEDRLSVLADAVEHPVQSTNELTFDEAQKVIKHMQGMLGQGAAAA